MWFNHPRYLNAKKCFIAESETSSLENLSSHLPKILFICGGDPKYFSNREIIENYLSKYHKHFLHFRAEHAWEAISGEANKSTNKTNALALEEWLAEFSDAVIILVESFGTVAELGAFSISEPLRKKLLPIINKKFEKDESFVNTGPVRWVDNDSVFSPSIYTDFSTILTCIPQLINRLDNNKVYKSRDTNHKFGKLNFSRKEFLFFVIHMVIALGPVSENELFNVSYRSIGYGKGTAQQREISFILSLCIALKIIQTTYKHGVLLFTCVDYIKLFQHNSTKRALSISQQLRARCLSDLICIPEFKKTLIEITSNAT
jgi:hypothetical protein